MAPNNKIKQEPFHKLMVAEIREMYERKLIDAAAYILLIVKVHGKAGWKWTFKVKDFCREWGINERTFYRAISKLKTLGLLHWETGDRITVWHGTDIAKSDEYKYPDTDVSLTDTDVSLTDTDDSGVTPMTIKNAVIPASKESCNASDSSQINTNNSDSRSREKFEIKRRQSAMPKEINPPSIEQLAQIDADKAGGAIRDYFLSTDGICKVVTHSFEQIPWWEYLDSY